VLKLSRKVVIWSVILYFALSIPLSLFHELGHILVCAAHGFDYALWVDGRGGHSLCYGSPRDGFTYNAMGGVFGMIGSAAIIAVWAFGKRHYAILAVGLAYMVDQFAKIILEGFFIRMYVSGALDGYITALQIISWLGFMLYFARIKEPATVVRA
jgi:hypothetical protein